MSTGSRWPNSSTRARTVSGASQSSLGKARRAMAAPGSRGASAAESGTGSTE